ncbi:hypothetical protein CCUS01_09912 [Colletotrichum cuscutae]|uniref:Uncharacterized protein n=1 Tax=Colletotrichum cuscutae TaxID=1209917 RepID=A0AAI9UE73_9PEZI|nr:hypothetical protein CCUS01_09912 [Colletotrichum cuscutae]
MQKPKYPVDLRLTMGSTPPPPPSQSGIAHVRLAPGSEEKSRDAPTLFLCHNLQGLTRRSQAYATSRATSCSRTWFRWSRSLGQVSVAKHLDDVAGRCLVPIINCRRMADIRRWVRERAVKEGMELDAAILGLKRQTGNPSTPSRTNRQKTREGHHPLLVIQHQGGRARESGEGWASEHSTVHSKEKGGGQYPGQRSQLFPLGVSAIPMVALPSDQDFLPRAIWSTASMASIGIPNIISAIAEAKTVIAGTGTVASIVLAYDRLPPHSLERAPFLSDHGLCEETTPWPCDDLAQEKAVWGLGPLKTPAKRQGNIGKVADVSTGKRRVRVGAQSVDGGQSCPGQTNCSHVASQARRLQETLERRQRMMMGGLGEAPSQLLVKAPSFSWGLSGLKRVVRRDPSSKTPSGQIEGSIYCRVGSVRYSQPGESSQCRRQQGHGLSWRPYERVSVGVAEHEASNEFIPVDPFPLHVLRRRLTHFASNIRRTLPDGPRDRRMASIHPDICYALSGKTGKLELGLEARPFNLRENGTLPCGHYKDEINYNRSAAVSREATGDMEESSNLKTGWINVVSVDTLGVKMSKLPVYETGDSDTVLGDLARVSQTIVRGHHIRLHHLSCSGVPQ